MSTKKFGAKEFFLRFAIALVLVVLTWNPSHYSYADWALAKFPNVSPQFLLAGLALAICWIIYIRATLRSLGTIGIILAGATLACIIWLLIDLGWLSLTNFSVFSSVVIVAVAFFLTVGLSWSHIRRRLSGQVDIDDVDE